MRNLNYQAVLNRVYRHYVVERQPPGIVDGRIHYHQLDDDGNDCPCAIGLFDTHDLLSGSLFEPPDGLDPESSDIDTLYLDCPELLADVFGVDSLSWDDVRFLSRVQSKHDYHAERQTTFCQRAHERFALEMGDSLERIARQYALKPLAF